MPQYFPHAKTDDIPQKLANTDDASSVSSTECKLEDFTESNQNKQTGTWDNWSLERSKYLQSGDHHVEQVGNTYGAESAVPDIRESVPAARIEQAPNNYREESALPDFRDPVPSPKGFNTGSTELSIPEAQNSTTVVHDETLVLGHDEVDEKTSNRIRLASPLPINTLNIMQQDFWDSEDRNDEDWQSSSTDGYEDVEQGFSDNPQKPEVRDMTRSPTIAPSKTDQLSHISSAASDESSDDESSDTCPSVKRIERPRKELRAAQVRLATARKRKRELTLAVEGMGLYKKVGAPQSYLNGSKVNMILRLRC